MQSGSEIAAVNLGSGFDLFHHILIIHTYIYVYIYDHHLDSFFNYFFLMILFYYMEEDYRRCFVLPVGHDEPSILFFLYILFYHVSYFLLLIYIYMILYLMIICSFVWTLELFITIISMAPSLLN